MHAMFHPSHPPWLIMLITKSSNMIGKLTKSLNKAYINTMWCDDIDDSGLQTAVLGRNDQGNILLKKVTKCRPTYDISISGAFPRFCLVAHTAEKKNTEHKMRILFLSTQILPKTFRSTLYLVTPEMRTKLHRIMPFLSRFNKNCKCSKTCSKPLPIPFQKILPVVLKT
jgi:hypothetical protein